MGRRAGPESWAAEGCVIDSCRLSGPALRHPAPSYPTGGHGQTLSLWALPSHTDSGSHLNSYTRSHTSYSKSHSMSPQPIVPAQFLFPNEVYLALFIRKVSLCKLVTFHGSGSWSVSVGSPAYFLTLTTFFWTFLNFHFSFWLLNNDMFDSCQFWLSTIISDPTLWH